MKERKGEVRVKVINDWSFIKVLSNDLFMVLEFFNSL